MLKSLGLFLCKMAEHLANYCLAVRKHVCRDRMPQRLPGPFLCPNGHENNYINACIINIAWGEGRFTDGYLNSDRDKLPLAFHCAVCRERIECEVTVKELIGLSP